MLHGTEEVKHVTFTFFSALSTVGRRGRNPATLGSADRDCCYNFFFGYAGGLQLGKKKARAANENERERKARWGSGHGSLAEEKEYTQPRWVNYGPKWLARTNGV
mmetsp:Transcript_7383/g.17195  ORF Transcript_7383/g.17195 Transcript_7383/m.17195 type:complete len:105 (-) Transcript_7383:93-407(-)